MSYFEKYERAIADALASTQFRGVDTDIPCKEKGLEEWQKLTLETKSTSGTIYFVGNGASASMSSHMSLDVTKNGGIKSLTFNDSAFLTAISNDIDYESVFALPIEKFGQEDDMLIAISSSGGSANIVAAVNAAKKQKMKVVTLTGMKPENPVRQLGDLNVYVPAETYGIVECCHQILVHCWLDKLMEIEPR